MSNSAPPATLEPTLDACVMAYARACGIQDPTEGWKNNLKFCMRPLLQRIEVMQSVVNAASLFGQCLESEEQDGQEEDELRWKLQAALKAYRRAPVSAPALDARKAKCETCGDTGIVKRTDLRPGGVEYGDRCPDCSPASRDGRQGEWVPWKPGDALPPHGKYWTTWFDPEFTYEPMVRPTYPHYFSAWGVTAYLLPALPPPYAPAATAEQGGEAL